MGLLWRGCWVLARLSVVTLREAIEGCRSGHSASKTKYYQLWSRSTVVTSPAPPALSLNYRESVLTLHVRPPHSPQSTESGVTELRRTRGRQSPTVE